PPSQANHVVDASPPAAALSPDTTPARPVTTTQYHVRPDDNLWDIAAKHLGDPRRYREIFELNRSRVQPDGRRLTRSGLIRPGWTLELPVPAAEPTEVSPARLQASASASAAVISTPAVSPPPPPSPLEQPG